jgi:formate-dependent nitrite reductase membrane component NrfD
LGLRWFAYDASAVVAGGLLSLVFTVLTTALLVFDLERPERFLRILFRPQWKSWLTRGAFLLVGFSLLLTVWWVLEAGARYGFWSGTLALAVRPFALWGGLPLAVGAASYTAFLFGQAEGRDLWQSTLLPFHLVVQAFMAGAAVLLVLQGMVPFADGFPADLGRVAGLIFGVSVGLDLLLTLMGEFGMPHASESAAQAAHEISHGRYRMHFWGGSIVLGHLVPLVLLVAGVPVLAAVGGVLSIAGLYLYEYAFVMAPQEVPNS